MNGCASSPRMTQPEDVSSKRSKRRRSFEVVKFEGDWALIAVEGQKLGYVPAEAVKKPH
jgi:hypothetical protein